MKIKGKGRIFLAHASEDKERVRSLYSKLKAHGLQPWIDEKDITPGLMWRDAIPDAIRRSDVFIALFSRSSVSKEGYVQSEFRTALTVLGEKPAGTIYFIPAKLEPCEIPDLRMPQLGVNLRDIQWVELYTDNGLDLLVEALSLRLSTSKIPAPEVEGVISKPFEWCYIPDGIVRLIKNQWDYSPGWTESEYEEWLGRHPLSRYQVDGFFMSKYPITSGQFGIFAASEHSDGRSWGDQWEGAAAEGTKEENHLYPALVTRFSAIAFCLWLSQKLGRTITVPSDVHWQRAAQGDEGRKFPFGNFFTSLRCNSRPSGINHLTPVNHYPSGASPFGVFDLAGNAQEWCVLHEEDFYQSGVFHPLGTDYFDNNPAHFQCLYMGYPSGPSPDVRAAFRICLPSAYRLEEIDP